MRRPASIAVIGLLIVATVTLQVSVFNHFAIGGVAPDLAFIVVIAAALLRGPEYAAVVGFAAGLTQTGRTPSF